MIWSVYNTYDFEEKIQVVQHNTITNIESERSPIKWNWKSTYPDTNMIDYVFSWNVTDLWFPVNSWSLSRSIEMSISRISIHRQLSFQIIWLNMIMMICTIKSKRITPLRSSRYIESTFQHDNRPEKRFMIWERIVFTSFDIPFCRKEESQNRPQIRNTEKKEESIFESQLDS